MRRHPIAPSKPSAVGVGLGGVVTGVLNALAELTFLFSIEAGELRDLSQVRLQRCRIRCKRLEPSHGSGSYH